MTGWHRGLDSLIRRGSRIWHKHPMPVTVSAWLAVLMLAVVWIPVIIVNRVPAWIQQPQYADNRSSSSGSIAGEAGTVQLEKDNTLIVPVYLSKEKRIEQVPLEHYVRGVVAAEMPIGFELEALKAQAIAARTYIVRRIAGKDFSDVPVEGAWVTDTVRHQAYMTKQQMEREWADKDNREINLQKLTRAVEETKGLIITFEGAPILAAFFSASGGYMENSEDYWPLKLPYLRSVESPWEQTLSPNFRTTATYSITEMMSKLGVRSAAVKAVSTGGGTAAALPMKVLERSEGQRIKQIQVGNRIFSGRHIRERLLLGSTQFTWRQRGEFIEFTVYGSGHGVGMSQWGAQGMAREGRAANEIISHYYKGVKIEKIHNSESTL